jgi:hypothetical protein
MTLVKIAHILITLAGIIVILAGIIHSRSIST